MQKEDRNRLIISYSSSRAKNDAFNRKRGKTQLEKKLEKGKLTKKHIDSQGYNKYLKLEGDITITIDYDKFNAFVYTMQPFLEFGSFGILDGWDLNPFDPSFTGLQLITAIEAIFLTTFVLMSQNSLNAQADKRADLNLQISLLSEHEITRLISLIKAIAQKLEIEEAKNPEINELSEEVVPDKLMDTLKSENQKSIKEAGN